MSLLGVPSVDININWYYYYNEHYIMNIIITLRVFIARTSQISPQWATVTDFPLRAGLERLPNLKPILHILKAKKN